MLTRLDESTYVVDPRALVEVHRQKPAGLIRKKRIDAHHVPAREVTYYHGIVERNEGLIRAVAALDLGQFAHAADEFVSTRRRVSALAGLRADKSSREYVLPTAK